MDFIITIILWILIILFLLNEVIIRVVGDAIVNMKASEHTPFTVDEITQDSISLSTTINVANEGKQCATIMDCYVRQLLPYEQFDGVKVEAKAELKGVPREDDYFEAVLIQKKESIDIVYQHAARYPWKISKETIVLTSEEIAKLADIKLAD